MAKPRIENEEIRARVLAEYGNQRLAFRPASNSWVLDGVSASIKDIAEDVSYVTHFPVQRIEIVLKRLAKEAKADAFEKLQQWITALEKGPTDDSELDKWLRLLEAEGTDREVHAANMHVMKQWLWQVKRSVLHQSVEWHVMPIFWSKRGGTGKSFNISRLIAPLENYSKNMSVSDIKEKFGDKQLSQTFIVFFDEFDGVGKVEISFLRAVLTGKAFDRRGIHSDSAVYAENRLSCIASTNTAPPHGYEDESGARRIWSIEVTSERMCDVRKKALDALDVARIWRAVSVEEVCPEAQLGEKMKAFMFKKREDHLRARSPLESFCEERLVKSVGMERTMKEFRSELKAYCSENSLKAPRGAYKDISHLLQKMGIKVNNGSGYFRVIDRALRGPEDPNEIA